MRVAARRASRRAARPLSKLIMLRVYRVCDPLSIVMRVCNEEGASRRDALLCCWAWRLAECFENE